MLRTKQYKYLLFPGTQPTERVLDVQADADEMKNLVADRALASELTRHRQLLAQWKKTTAEDNYPLQAAAQSKRKKAKR